MLKNTFFCFLFSLPSRWELHHHLLCVSMTTHICNYLYSNLFVIIFIVLACSFNLYACMLSLSILSFCPSLPLCIPTCIFVSQINHSLSLTLVYPAYLLPCTNQLSARNGIATFHINHVLHSLYLHMYLHGLLILLYVTATYVHHVCNYVECQFNSPAICDLLTYNAL